MKTITKIAGVDNKIGRRSRTGSTVSMTVPDEFINDCTEYFLAHQQGKQPTGKLKSIELILYYEDVEEDEVYQKMNDNLDEVLNEESTEIKERLPANQRELDLYDK